MSDIDTDAQAGGQEPGSQEDEVQFVGIDLWLNRSKSGKGVVFNSGDGEHFAARSLVEGLIDPENGEITTVSFSDIVDKEFENSGYYMAISKSGKAVNMPYHDNMVTMPVENLKRLLDGEIKGAKFKLLVRK